MRRAAPFPPPPPCGEIALRPERRRRRSPPRHRHSERKPRPVPAQPAPWQLEHIKRRLGDFAARIAPSQRLLLLSTPAADDIPAQLRLAGLQALCAAHGIALRQARPGEQPGADALGVWLGDGAPPSSARLLAWPAPERAAAVIASLAEAGRKPLLLCLPDAAHQAIADRAGLGRGVLLPDPLHALFGLLDCHPAGEGVLALGSDAVALLPPARLRWLERAQSAEQRGLGHAAFTRLARRRLLEALRSLMVRHRVLHAGETATAILGLMLGREVRPEGEAARALPAYWACWGEPLA